MKFCSQCGYQNEDNDMYCRKCGFVFFSAGSPQPSAPRAASVSPAISAVKSAGSSALFLISVILFTFSFILQVVNAIIGVNENLFSQYYDLLNFFGMGEFVETVYESVQYTILFTSLIVILPTVFIMIGMWMFYASCQKKINSVSTSGLTMIKVITIIQMVLTLIALTAALVICIIGLIQMSDLAYEFGYTFGLGGFVAGTLIGAIFAIIVGIVFTIFYNLKILRTIKYIKKAAKTGTPDNRVSVFLPVMNFILSFFTIISAFSSITTSILQFFINGLQAAFLIMISIGIFMYRKTMTDLSYPNTYGQVPVYNPQYQQPAYSPQQQNTQFTPPYAPPYTQQYAPQYNQQQYNPYNVQQKYTPANNQPQFNNPVQQMQQEQIQPELSKQAEPVEQNEFIYCTQCGEKYNKNESKCPSCCKDNND